MILYLVSFESVLRDGKCMNSVKILEQFQNLMLLFIELFNHFGHNEDKLATRTVFNKPNNKMARFIIHSLYSVIYLKKHWIKPWKLLQQIKFGQ